MPDATSFTRPLAPGTSFGYWRVSEIAEERYDLPDEPMPGGMDATFFLTRDRNFIPHEYPCRTRFAADYRGRRPDVRGTPTCTHNRLPFGAPDLDLSGFWFRPTRLAAWAETRIATVAAGPTRFRLSTCGGAVLFVNGAEAGFLSPYERNRELSVEIVAELPVGTSEIRVFLDDLAERDTRFAIRLDWLGGPSARPLLPFDADRETVAAVETTLEAMCFERPSFAAGPVRLSFPKPLPLPARAILHDPAPTAVSHVPLIHVEGLAAGAEHCTLAAREELPPGFRSFSVTLEADGFSAARTVAAEIIGGSEPASPDPADRIAEALATVAAQGEPDAVTALARLATGYADTATEAIIARDLAKIADCWDCADFALVPLLWIRARYHGHLSPRLLARIDQTVAGYRYWLDEPGNDVQWYFSENHALLFHTAAYLAGHLLPDVRFPRSGRLGAEQSAVGRERVRDGSTTSSAGKWPSSTPPPTSPSTSRV